MLEARGYLMEQLIWKIYKIGFFGVLAKKYFIEPPGFSLFLLVLKNSYYHYNLNSVNHFYFHFFISK